MGPTSWQPPVETYCGPKLKSAKSKMIRFTSLTVQLLVHMIWIHDMCLSEQIMKLDRWRGGT